MIDSWVSPHCWELKRFLTHMCVYVYAVNNYNNRAFWGRYRETWGQHPAHIVSRLLGQKNMKACLLEQVLFWAITSCKWQENDKLKNMRCRQPLAFICRARIACEGPRVTLAKHKQPLPYNNPCSMRYSTRCLLSRCNCFWLAHVGGGLTDDSAICQGRRDVENSLRCRQCSQARR